MEISFATMSQESEASSASPFTAVSPSKATATATATTSRKRQRRHSSRISLVTVTTILSWLSLICTFRISLYVSAYVPSPLFPCRTKWIHDGISISSMKKNNNKSTKSTKSQHHAVPISQQWKLEKDGDRDLDKEEAGWLSWMVRGSKVPRPKEMEEPPVPAPWSRKAFTKRVSGLGRKMTRGSSDLRMREPKELGGLPRPDRYSSRYVNHIVNGMEASPHQRQSSEVESKERKYWASLKNVLGTVGLLVLIIHLIFSLFISSIDYDHDHYPIQRLVSQYNDITRIGYFARH